MTADVTQTINARPVLVKALLNSFDNYRYFIMRSAKIKAIKIPVYEWKTSQNHFLRFHLLRCD